MAFSGLPDRSICQTFALRDQHSWDFLVCEGQRGWSATHVIMPFALMILSGNFLLSFLIAGAVEIFEALALTAVGSYIVFHTNDAELETKAGSLLGDWLINDLLGVLLAFILLRALQMPGLLRIVLDRWKWWPQAMAPQQKALSEFRFSEHKGITAVIAIWTAAFLATGIMPTFILPSDCDQYVEQNCINAGLMLMVATQVCLIIAGWFVWMRLKVFRLHFWARYGLARKTYRWRIHVLFAAWLAFVILVGLQNAQPYIPLFIAPVIGEWAQVWTFAGIWLVLTLAVIYGLRVREQNVQRSAHPRSLKYDMKR